MCIWMKTGSCVEILGNSGKRERKKESKTHMSAALFIFLPPPVAHCQRTPPGAVRPCPPSCMLATELGTCPSLQCAPSASLTAGAHASLPLSLSLLMCFLSLSAISVEHSGQAVSTPGPQRRAAPARPPDLPHLSPPPLPLHASDFDVSPNINLLELPAGLRPNPRATSDFPSIPSGSRLFPYYRISWTKINRFCGSWCR